jgi:hypothetical protein
VLLSVAVHGPLVIDTQGPRVTGVSADATTGRIFVTIQDPLSGLNQSALVNPDNYRLFSVRPRRREAITLNAASPTSATGSQTVVIMVNSGQPLSPGVQLLRIVSTGVTDRAGNALRGTFFGVFPSGRRRNGGDFLALLLTDGAGVVRVRPVRG